MKYEKCNSNEIFVGNTSNDRNLSYLKDVTYRLGSVAYDIHGKELHCGLLPLFVDKDSMYKYNEIMTNK